MAAALIPIPYLRPGAWPACWAARPAAPARRRGDPWHPAAAGSSAVDLLPAGSPDPPTPLARGRPSSQHTTIGTQALTTQRRRWREKQSTLAAMREIKSTYAQTWWFSSEGMIMYPLGRLLVPPLRYIGITPNGLTLFNVLVGLVRSREQLNAHITLAGFSCTEALRLKCFLARLADISDWCVQTARTGLLVRNGRKTMAIVFCFQLLPSASRRDGRHDGENVFDAI